MLNALIRVALQNRLLVVLVSVVLLLVGGFSAARMPIDVFPDLDRPRVIILTECRGLATEEVESLVTQPIEIALLGASGVQVVRSQSASGLCVVYVEFDWETEIRIARQTVQERLTTLGDILPPGILPRMTPPASIMGQIMVAGIYRQQGPNGGELYPIQDTSFLLEVYGGPERRVAIWKPTDRHQPETWQAIPYDSATWIHAVDGTIGRSDTSNANTGELSNSLAVSLAGREYRLEIPSVLQQRLALRTIADWVIRPRLLETTGVAEALAMGGAKKQYQVRIDPAALLEYDVSLKEVEQALRESNINTSGGFAVTGETERPIRVLGRLGPEPAKVLEDLRSIPVKANRKRSILVEQVANVVEGASFKRGDGSINGRDGVVFTIVKQPHVDTRALTERLELALGEVEKNLPANFVVNNQLFQLRNFIDRGIFNVGEALAIGALLVSIILFLFLVNFRTTFISLAAIPLSLVTTVLVFRIVGHFTGTQISLNVMTLGGIAVALGELVDDAIVDVENIFRRLKENAASQAPKPAIRIVYEASCEIRSAIVFGTAVVILVFLPLFALSGVEGRFFVPMGIAYIVSILSSLLVSLTVTPVLASYLLPHAPATKEQGDGFVLRGLKRLARPLVQLSLRQPVMLLLISWMLVAWSAWEVSRLGVDFLPNFDEGSVQVNVTLPSGASLDASNRVAANIERTLLDNQQGADNPNGQIRHFVRRTGRAELDEHASPVNVSEYILSMNPDVRDDRDTLINELLVELKEQAPGAAIEVEQPLAHLISHMLSGVYAQIAIKIFGEDLYMLRKLAEQIQAELATVEGITAPIVEPVRMTEELQIKLRPDDLEFYGLTRSYVASILETALQGQVISQVLQGQRRFDLLVRLEEDYRTDYANLGRLRIDLPEGGQIELRELADVGSGSGPNAINRENARRRLVIRCNTQGRDLGSAVDAIRQKIDRQVVLPDGYFVEYGGQFESQRRASRTIFLLAGVSIAGVAIVMLVLFPSLRIVLQIMNALPTAFIGGVVALVITQQSLTIASLVGFISLGGIAIRNGILLVSHYFHLLRNENEDFSEKMILRGSLERLAPVLMTALTAGIGLLPLVLGGDEPGREILYPVATVILGGLVTSTFCEFLIHPGLFWRFSGQDAVGLASHSQTQDDLLVESTIR